MRLLVEELAIAKRDENLKSLAEFRKIHPKKKNIMLEQVPFFEDFVVTAKSKEATKTEIMEAFKDIPTIILAGNIPETGFLSLSQGFALLMAPVGFKELEYYHRLLVQILDKF